MIKIISTTKARANISDIINVNAYSNSFDFLKNEPDLYNIFDIKKKYV